MGKTVSAMSLQRTKQYEFETFVREHRRIVGKVCYLYAMDSDDFDDLYQEVLITCGGGSTDSKAGPKFRRGSTASR